MKLRAFNRSGLLLLALFLSVTSCTTTAYESTSPAEGPLSSRDLNTLMNWWQGDYDNDAQIDTLRADGAPIWQPNANEDGQKFGGHLTVRAHYRRVDMPAFGDHVLYVEETLFGEVEKPYRQRIYTVVHDESGNTIRVKLWYFKDKTSYLGAWRDMSRIAELTPDDMSPLPDNCDMNVERVRNDRYHMKMPTNGCVFGSKLFDYQVIVGAGTFWFRDRIVNAQTAVVEMSAGNFTYHELTKR